MHITSEFKKAIFVLNMDLSFWESLTVQTLRSSVGKTLSKFKTNTPSCSALCLREEALRKPPRLYDKKSTDILETAGW